MAAGESGNDITTRFRRIGYNDCQLAAAGFPFPATNRPLGRWSDDEIAKFGGWNVPPGQRLVPPFLGVYG